MYEVIGACAYGACGYAHFLGTSTMLREARADGVDTRDVGFFGVLLMAVLWPVVMVYASAYRPRG